jgi:hypothetical protein
MPVQERIDSNRQRSRGHNGLYCRPYNTIRRKRSIVAKDIFAAKISEASHYYSLAAARRRKI